MTASVELRDVTMDFDKYRAVDNVSVKIDDFLSRGGTKGERREQEFSDK